MEFRGERSHQFLLPRNSQINWLLFRKYLIALFLVLPRQLLMKRLSYILQLPPNFIHQRLMPNLTHRIPPIQEPPRHILRAAKPPMRHDLLRLHVLEAGLLEVLFDFRGGGPFRVRDDGGFEAGV